MRYLSQCLFTYTFIIASFFTAHSQNSAGALLKEMQWDVDGVVRKALVYEPASYTGAKSHPLIFAYHGHGGTMQNMYRTHRFDQLWPDAIVVYPQGLKTPGSLTDPEGKKTGWQQLNSMGNRDLIFFDTLLTSLKKEFNIDNDRIYATGHSNGGNFVYQLWSQRGEIFAAFAPTSTLPGKNILALKPKPVFVLTGQNDPLVKPGNQYVVQEKLLKLNECSSTGRKAGAHITHYPSSIGAPVELYIHKGGHEYPPDANAAMIKFFKEQAKKS